MKNFYSSRMLIILLFGILNPTQLFAQWIYNNVGHIPQSNQVSWTNAGLVSDLTPQSADFVYDVTQMPGYIQGTYCDAQVDTALSRAENDNGVSIIYFPGGIYKFNAAIVLTAVSGNNIIFQGAGSSNTTLEFTVGSTNRCFLIQGEPIGNPMGMNCTVYKGSNTLSPTNFNFSSHFSDGDWIHFYEASSPYVEGDFENAVGQITQLEDVNYFSGTMKDEASKAYSPGYGLTIQKILPVTNVGIENLKLKRLDSGDSGSGENIFFKYAVNCWVKGVESDKTCRHHVEIYKSSHIEVSGCYFHHARSYNQGGRGYGVSITFSSTNCLVENNIFKYLRHAMVVQGGANSNVIAYNYSREQHWEDTRVPDWMLGLGGDLLVHGNYPYANLMENNWVEKIWADDACPDIPDWIYECEERVNGPYSAFVRNKAQTHVGIRTMMTLESGPNTSALGCELREDIADGLPIVTSGDADVTTDIYGIWTRSGETYESAPIFTHNQLVTNNGFLVKNYMHLHDFSYYYSVRPSFLSDDYTFPSIGPEIGLLSQNIPAHDRYDNTVKTYIDDLM